ncbi:MAG: hypothetical protein WC395_05555 [Bacteroidales bacterium]|jgi:hypothetical protein
MKKLVLSLVLMLMVIGTYGQNYNPARESWYRNELFLEPTRFFEGTFALGYQRNFYNSALSLMPSVTLMGESIFRNEDNFFSELEGFGLEGIYKVFFARMPRKVQVYAGPYVSYRFLKEKNRLPDYIDPQDLPNITNSDMYTRYNTVMAGVLFGVHFMFGRFTMDMNVGGGLRYPNVTGFRTRYPSVVSVPSGFGEFGYKGVVPKTNISLGVAF